jgi:hypothetical protein
MFIMKAITRIVAKCYLLIHINLCAGHQQTTNYKLDTLTVISDQKNNAKVDTSTAAEEINIRLKYTALYYFACKLVPETTRKKCSYYLPIHEVNIWVYTLVNQGLVFLSASFKVNTESLQVLYSIKNNS